jgi:hypothetical protein
LDFDAVVADVKNTLNAELSRINVSGGTPEQLTLSTHHYTTQWLCPTYFLI